MLRNINDDVLCREKSRVLYVGLIGLCDRFDGFINFRWVFADAVGALIATAALHERKLNPDRYIRKTEARTLPPSTLVATFCQSLALKDEVMSVLVRAFAWWTRLGSSGSTVKR